LGIAISKGDKALCTFQAFLSGLFYSAQKSNIFTLAKDTRFS